MCASEKAWFLSRIFAFLSLEFHNWIDEAYPAQPYSDNVTHRVHNGATVLLECLANTTNIVPKVSWYLNGSFIGNADSIALSNHYGLSSGSLLVREISLSQGKDLMYECEVVLAQPSDNKLRRFNLSLLKKGIY